MEALLDFIISIVTTAIMIFFLYSEDSCHHMEGVFLDTGDRFTGKVDHSNIVGQINAIDILILLLILRRVNCVLSIYIFYLAKGPTNLLVKDHILYPAFVLLELLLLPRNWQKTRC